MIHGGIILKKIDVDSKIFYGSVFFSILCFSELLRHIINPDIDALSYIRIVVIASCIISLIITKVLVEKDSVGLENGKCGLIVVISSFIFLLMFIGVL